MVRYFEIITYPTPKFPRLHAHAQKTETEKLYMKYVLLVGLYHHVTVS
jgi:hypothetical protein